MIIINFFKKFIKLFILLAIKLFEKIIIIALKIFSLKLIFQREDRIGHQIGNFECDLCEAIKLKETNFKTIFIFFETNNLIANKYAQELILKVLDINNINYFIFRNIFLSGILKILINNLEDSFYLKKVSRDNENTLINPLFEGLLDNSIIKDLGLKEKEYVCIYNRESKYLTEKYSGFDFSYHNYRDSNIDNLKDLSYYLKNYKKLPVIRVGSNSKNKINWECDQYPFIFDYSKSSFQSDKNDIDLISNCFLYINNGGGPFSIASSAKREMITINQIPTFGNHLGNKIWIPKLIKGIKTNKYLSITDLINLNIHYKINSKTLDKYSLICLENTSEDILLAVKDFFKMKNNNLSEEDEKLIQKYHLLISSKGLEKLPSKPLTGSIAPSFLRRYSFLLS